jgi:uncharacterized protein
MGIKPSEATKRQEGLKKIIRRLHEGHSVDEVKKEFSSLLGETDAGEIAALEQALISEGMPETEIKRLCDVHVAVFEEGLAKQNTSSNEPVAINRFKAENLTALEDVNALEQAVQKADWPSARRALQSVRRLEDHYLRKEHALFPYLEKHGFTGPSSVMWAIHNDIRAEWKQLDTALAGTPVAADVKSAFDTLAQSIRGMVQKEENVLFPAAKQHLSALEWTMVAADEQAAEAYAPNAAAPELIPLKIGALTVEQIQVMLTHLPVDITFVDEQDTVRFFSATKERIFKRTPDVIGRKVQRCHPPASVHHVQKILDDFRANKRDVAEFWIALGEKFVHIRYFALRDSQGGYMGTLEVSQDVAGIRALQGERRLLDD